MSSSEEQQLRQRIFDICSSENCDSISFNIEGTNITGVGLRSVAKLVTSDRIHIKIKKQDKDAGASYDPKENKFSFPTVNFGLSLFEKSLIVHECTHALIDVNKSKTLTIIDELCAYTAQFTYLQPLISAGLFRVDPDESSIFLAANIVASHVMAGTNLNIMPAATDVNNLRYAIYLAPLYKDLNKYRNDYSLTDGV